MRRLVGRQGLTELAIVGGCALLYFLIRGNVADRADQANAAAMDIVAIERRLRIYWEPAWQQAFLASREWTQFWNQFYFWLHGPLIVVVGLIRYFGHRGKYLVIRTAFLISCVVGLLVYNFYPLTPPRLLPELGYVDTMRLYSPVAYQAESTKAFTNPYAAMPSLHYGWSFLIAVGIAWTWPRWWAHAFAAVETFGMVGAVVITANHWLLDVAAGGALCLLALALAWWLHQGRAPRRVAARPRARG